MTIFTLNKLESKFIKNKLITTNTQSNSCQFIFIQMIDQSTYSSALMPVDFKKSSYRKCMMSR